MSLQVSDLLESHSFVLHKTSIMTSQTSCQFGAFTDLAACDQTLIFTSKDNESLTKSIGGARTVHLAVPATTRNNSCYPSCQSLTKKLQEQSFEQSSSVRIHVVLDSADQAIAAVHSIIRAFPVFSLKTVNVVILKLYITFVTKDSSSVDYIYIQTIADGASLTKKLVEMPTNHLDTAIYHDIITKNHADLVAAGYPVTLKSIAGTELRDGGFGGLWGVGKAAERLPILAILSFTPASPVKTVAWIGKGIVYDTGGLSIKTPTTNMCGMKSDMGGSAAVLGAFNIYVKSSKNAPHLNTIHAIFCLAENAIGPLAVRNDDVLNMYSGKTVEINNTDAEGRLVMADGVAYASKHLNPDLIIDIATLTGAQLITTGKRHAGLVCNDDVMEALVIKSGKATGNIVFPMLYAPEVLFATQFSSKIADMKNSVKDRANAQASSAGHFVESHLVGDKWDYTKKVEKKGLWVHLDIAGVATDSDDMGTGYGPALLNEIVRSFK